MRCGFAVVSFLRTVQYGRLLLMLVGAKKCARRVTDRAKILLEFSL